MTFCEPWNRPLELWLRFYENMRSPFSPSRLPLCANFHWERDIWVVIHYIICKIHSGIPFYNILLFNRGPVWKMPKRNLGYFPLILLELVDQTNPVEKSFPLLIITIHSGQFIFNSLKDGHLWNWSRLSILERCPVEPIRNEYSKTLKNVIGKCFLFLSTWCLEMSIMDSRYKL